MPGLGSAALIELARALKKRTDADELDWTPVEREPTSYQASLPSGIVRVRSVDMDGAPPVELVIYGPAGGPPLDSLTTRGVDTFSPEAIVSTLYETVRRRVLGVDSVIANLLGDLAEKEPASDEDIPF
jgi:hypothetical protein